MDKKNELVESQCTGSINKGVTCTSQSPANTDVSRAEEVLDWVPFTIRGKSVQEVAESILCLPAEDDVALDGRIEKMVEAYNESVKDDDSVKNLVHKSCVPYVLELQDRCFLEGPPPDESETA